MTQIWVILELPPRGHWGGHWGRELSHKVSISGEVASHSGGWLKETLKQEEKKDWDQYVARWLLPLLLFFSKCLHNSLIE